MATYYIDYNNGSDSNNGLGPDASAVTNKPWQTLSKALSTGSPVTSGDTVYLAPAIHRIGATITINISPSSTVNILGDPGNAQGFKTAAGVVVSAGPVIASTFSAGDTTTNTYQISYNGKSNFAWQYIQFEGGITNDLHAFGTVSSSANVTFTDCSFHTKSINCASATAAFGVALNITFDRCIFICRGSSVTHWVCTEGSGSDYDINVVFTNSLFLAPGAIAIQVLSTGSNSQFGNGVHVHNCTFIGTTGISCNTTGLSTSHPTTCYNSAFICGTGFIANATGMITEDYNNVDCATTRTNVTAGTHSQAYNSRMQFGQERFMGLQQRGFGEPGFSSPLSGFGNDGNQTSYDGFNRPRPSDGQQNQVGWLSRANTATQATNPPPPTGTYIWQDTGPWYQDFILPVNTASQTLSIKTQHDSNYTGTLPQMIILGQPEIGVTTQTITDVGSSGTWNTLTATTINPTAVGAITVRIVSNDTSGSSVVEFANFAVT